MNSVRRGFAMEFNQLRYYLQLCEDHSFAVAADHLFITQQALRKSIKNLEEELGVELFYRRGNAINPTPAGDCLKANALLISRDYEMMLASMHSYRQDADYTEVSVAIANGCYDRVASRAIEPFKEDNPHIGVKITELPDLLCENYVIRGIVDFGLCPGPNDAGSFDSVTLDSAPLVALVNKENRLAGRDSLTLQDLSEELIGIADERYKIFHNFNYACRQAGITPHIDFFGGDPYSTHHYSHVTKNVSITADAHARKLAESNQVVIPIKDDTLKNDFNVVMRHRATLSNNALRLIEYCKRALAEPAASQNG